MKNRIRAELQAEYTQHKIDYVKNAGEGLEGYNQEILDYAETDSLREEDSLITQYLAL